MILQIGQIYMVVVVLFDIAHARAGYAVDPNIKSGPGQGAGNSDYQTEYCVSRLSRCSRGMRLETKPVITAFQCLARCNRHPDCVTVFIAHGSCTLMNERCAPGQLNEFSGTDYYRLKKGESCTENRPKFVASTVKFSNTFCMLKGKVCPGRDIYRKPQNIKPMLKCLEKCARIKTCASVDFVDNKCQPKTYHCEDSELVEDADALNFQRLIEGVETCSPDREIATTPAPTAPPSVTVLPPPCPPHSSRVDVGPCVCDGGYKKVKGVCTKACSDNEEKVNGQCQCRPGFERVGKTCEKECTANSGRSGSGQCECNRGFQHVRGECLKECVFNAERDSSGVCQCKSGHELIGQSCLKRCVANAVRSGRRCKCSRGYLYVGTACMKSCPSNSYRLRALCLCRSGYTMIGSQCVRQLHYPCTLPIRSGHCRAYFRRYGYDAAQGRCRLFGYGGCSGNANRFLLLSQCEAKCHS